MLWNTRVTSLQLTGYGIALAGLVYYKIGGDQNQLQSLRVMAENRFHMFMDEFSVQKRILTTMFYLFIIVLLFVLLSLRSGFI